MCSTAVLSSLCSVSSNPGSSEPSLWCWIPMLHQPLTYRCLSIGVGCLQIRRPNNYDINVSLMLGPTEPDPTMDVSSLDIVKTVVQDSPHKLFIGGLPCDWSEDQVRTRSTTPCLVHARAGLPGHCTEKHVHWWGAPRLFHGSSIDTSHGCQE